MKRITVIDLEHVLSYTRTLWEKTRGKRIFLTGATGFFGAWLLESLAYCNRELDLGLEAVVLCRNPEVVTRKLPHLASEKSIRFLAGDVRTFEFPHGDFEFVIHAAASSSGPDSRPSMELLTTLVHGTERVLAFARTRGTKYFLFVSSGAVYGPQPISLSHIPETFLGGPDWLHPSAVYSEGKRISEQMCSLTARSSDIKLSIARCFAFVGPHLPLDQHFAIGNFIGDALANRNLTVSGDGTPIRSYLYAADMAVWLWTLLLSELDPDSTLRVMNVGSGEAISISDLATTVIAELNPSMEMNVARKPIASAPLLQYVPDVREAETRLGLRQTISLREAIRRTAEWYR